MDGLVLGDFVQRCYGGVAVGVAPPQYALDIRRAIGDTALVTTTLVRVHVDRAKSLSGAIGQPERCHIEHLTPQRLHEVGVEGRRLTGRSGRCEDDSRCGVNAKLRLDSLEETRRVH